MNLSLRALATATLAAGAVLCTTTPAFADWGPADITISGSAAPTNGSIAVAPLPGADALAVFSDAGTNAMLWQRFDGATDSWDNAPSTLAASSDPTSGTALATFTDSGNPRVRAVWRAGDFHVASGNTIMTSVFDPGAGTWTTASAVSGSGAAWGEAPTVATGGGETYVTWAGASSGADGGSLRISRLMDDGTTWSDTTFAPVGGLARSINAVVDGNGNATVLWTVDGSPYVWVSHRGSGDAGAWSTPAHLAEPDTGAGFADTAPRLVVDSAGVVTAAFTRFDTENGTVVSRDIHATRYDPAAESPAWTIPVRVSRAGESSFEPVLAVDGSDAVTLAWDAALGAIADGSSGLLVSRFDPAVQSPAWTTPEVIYEGATSRPVRLTAVGTATMVTWRGGSSLMAMRRAASGAWSAPIVVNASGESPVVASTSSASAMFLYAMPPFDDPAWSYAGAGARFLDDSGSGPGVPQGVTASPDRNGVKVQYSPPGNLGYWGAATYRVTASPGGATCATATVSCTLTGLDANQEYTFTVVAEGPGGNSAASAPSSATRPGGPTAPSGTRLWWGNWGYSLNGLSTSTTSGAFGDTVVPGVSAWGLAADPARGRVYFVDIDAAEVKWINADGTGQVQTLTDAHGPREGLSLDTTTGKLYWSTSTESIAWANSADPGENGELYASTDPAVRTPASVAVDPGGNRIYWANYADGTVGYGDLSVAGNANVITLSGCPSQPTSAYGVAVDPGADSLYVATAMSGGGYAVLKTQMDGSNCAVLATSNAEILGLAVDAAQNRVYYAEDSAIEYVDLANPGASNAVITSALVDYPGYPMLFGVPTGTASLSASGTQTGATVTCAAEWAADAPGRGMYQAPRDTTISWERDDAPMPGATGTTLVAEAAGTYRCAATGVNAAGETTVRSSEITVAAPPAPAPAPAPVTEAPAPAAPPTGSASGPTVSTLSPPAATPAGDNRTRLTFRLRLSQTGRYTFILQKGTAPAPPAGRRAKRARVARPAPPRVEFLAGSRIGDRTLTAPSSAPVLRGATAGQDLTVVALISGTPPANLMLNAVAASRQGGLQGSLFPVAG